MKYLFIHQNFPGQYAHLVKSLCAAGHSVIAIGQRSSVDVEGLRFIGYTQTRDEPGGHPYLEDMNQAVEDGLKVARICEGLAREGFKPDVVVGHSGWGEILFVKDVWPDVPLLGYFEFFYRSSGSDVDFDPEFPVDDEAPMRLRARNAVNLLSLQAADWGQTPTTWQRDQYPARFHSHISVLHEGVDADVVKPDPNAQLWLRGGRTFGLGDELLTYCARSLEPYRGFHVFMRALPKLLSRRPAAHVAIVGDFGVSYGRPPFGGSDWRSQLLAELEGTLDLDRVHFLGSIPYRQYLTLLQVSAAHCYLTYPFVLSWSLIEALAAGCSLVASRTPPVEEAIDDGRNGRLVDFFDVNGLADALAEALSDRGSAHDKSLRAAARDTALGRYDLKTVCLPQQLELLHSLVGRGSRGDPSPMHRSLSNGHSAGLSAKRL